MEKNLIGEMIFVLVGSLMIISPSLFLKLLSKFAQVDYENKKRSFAWLKKRDPGTYTFNERVALKNEKLMWKVTGDKKDIYGPQTTTQKWLMRILGVLLVVVAIVIFIQGRSSDAFKGH